MGASPREHRRCSARFRVMAVATMGFATLGVGCAETDPETAPAVSTAPGGWVDDHESAIVRLEGAIETILSAVEGNDVRLLGDGPERCAAEAGTLARAADDAGAQLDGTRLDEVAALCEWLSGPAHAHDVAGVVRTLDPLFTAVGLISPLLGDRTGPVS